MMQLVILFILSTLFITPIQAQFTASGVVQNPSGSPVAGVQVALQADPGVNTLTDAQGRFDFSHPTLGTGKVHSGFQFVEISGNQLVIRSGYRDQVHFNIRNSAGKTVYESADVSFRRGSNKVTLPAHLSTGSYFAGIRGSLVNLKLSLAVTEGKYKLTSLTELSHAKPLTKTGMALMEASKQYWHSTTQNVTNGATDVVIILEKLPNMVLILSDDQSWTDYGFMGHDIIETPRIDLLAEQSLTFRRGYVPISLCRPSLMTLATGRFPHQHGITGNDPDQTPRDVALKHIDREVTLWDLLSEKGYVSLQTGKWWEGSWERGRFSAGMTRGSRHGDDGLTIGREGLGPIDSFIDSIGEAPFYVWYAPFLPHTPHTPPQRLEDKYAALVESEFVARYYAMVEWFDETVGELLDMLEDKGLSENTIIFYACDNGWLQNENANGPDFSVSKQSPYDLGIRTPIMIKWPGKVTPEMDDSTLVSTIDHMPTLLAAAGIDIPENVAGVNLFDPSMPHKSRPHIMGSLYNHNLRDIDNPAASLEEQYIIEGNMKLIVLNVTSQNPVTELYDIVADPLEQTDVSGANAATVTRLKAIIDEWYPDSFPFSTQ